MSIIKEMYADSLVQIAHATHNDRFSFPNPLCRICAEGVKIAKLDQEEQEEVEYDE